VRWLARIVALAALAAFFGARAWACLLGVAHFVGWGWAPILVALLLWLRLVVVLQIAIFFGAVMAWHLPVLVALWLAVPRLFLVLPGLVSTFLASHRHPRARWTVWKA
jgi:hypothetical protein